jgi:protein-disulfide isomerase
METLRKFATPIAIVVAGALVASAVYLGIVNRPVDSQARQPVLRAPIRGMQESDHVIGDRKAGVVIVEYSDPECPYCKTFHGTLHRVMSEFRSTGQVAWVYRHYPIEELHPKAAKEAEALECAAEQGGNDIFWKYANTLYETTQSNNSLDIGVYNVPVYVPVAPNGAPYYTQRLPRHASDAGLLSDLAKAIGLDVAAFESCLGGARFASRVREDLDESVAAGGTGTPFTVIIAGDSRIPIEGALSYTALKKLIESLLD